MSRKQEICAAVSEFVKAHLMMLSLALAGVVLAVLFIVIGFWYTVLIVALGSVGGAFGFWLDKRRNAEKQQSQYIFFDE